MRTGDLVNLAPERPVAGGRMLAHHEGRVVLVAGAIPGERVRARVERATRQVAWAHVVDVLEASPDRREPGCDLACGGSLYAHIRYPRQLRLKSEVIADAFRHIAKIGLEQPVNVQPSPERGYRVRARLHVGGGRVGFFREGTHTICDAAATGQLRPEALAAVDAVLQTLATRSAGLIALVVAENIAATERVVHLEQEGRATEPDVAALGAGLTGLTGITSGLGGQAAVLCGEASVTDTAADLFGRESPVGASVRWTRHAPSFFQGNRFLAGALARRVLALADGDRLVDLYSGVGLFAVAAASLGKQVAAVEGDPLSGRDLIANAAPWRDRLRVMTARVEDALAVPPGDPPDVAIVNPPRTGLSATALPALLAWQVRRLVYVSCDPPTLARDAARCVIAGYRLQSVEAFDLFPNTPHVETVAVFQRL